MMHDAESFEPERYELAEPPRYVFSLSRRAFVQSVGAGLLITAIADWHSADAQNGRNEEREAGHGRFHIDKEGRITAFTGKVEVGQGARTQLTQAAAEELRVPVEMIALVMADTGLVPNDGGTYGSQTTPRTVPIMRRAAAATRELLIELACAQWDVPVDGASISDGVITHTSGKKMTLAELVVSTAGFDETLRKRAMEFAELSPTESWRTLGKPTPRINAVDIVTGKHSYTSDIKRPGMLYGKVLRPPRFGAELLDVDLAQAEAIDGVVAVRDGAFVGVAAPTSFAAQKAITALAASAKWEEKSHPSNDAFFVSLKKNAGESSAVDPSSENASAVADAFQNAAQKTMRTELFRYFGLNTREGSGRQRSRSETSGDVDAALATAKTTLRAEYHIPYIQHAPMETRTAVAEFDGDALTVWTGTQRPFDVGREVAEALGMPADKVRLIVPDTGGGFGGKHSGDAAVEAARLARAAKRPVAMQWTREEEFTWAYFRPAGVIEVAAAIDAAGEPTAFDFTNYNSGTSGIECPYAIKSVRTRFRNCESPLRQGSYRGLAATANNFAREAFIDELAAALNVDPLTFRRNYVKEPRLAAVIEAAAKEFDFENRRSHAQKNSGYGIACGTEKGSYVATCAEVTVDPASNSYTLGRVCVVFECGAIQNPPNLRAQVEGSVIMGLGAALREAVQFEDGKILNPHFYKYKVPRFSDVPEIDVVILDRPDLPSAGAGETPIIGIAPAIANALFHATGKPVRALPLTLG